MPLNTDALTTLLAAQQKLRNDGDTSSAEDAEIERLINGISRTIRRRTGREFVPKVPALDSDPEVTRSFEYDGAGYLQLAPFEARSISEVKLDGTVLATTSYKLEPTGQTLEATYTWLRLPTRDYSSKSLLLQTGTLDIKGRWAAGVIPPDVELACLIEVDRRWQNPEGFEDRSLGGFSFGDSSSERLSDEAEALLAPFTVPLLG